MSEAWATEAQSGAEAPSMDACRGTRQPACDNLCKSVPTTDRPYRKPQHNSREVAAGGKHAVLAHTCNSLPDGRAVDLLFPHSSGQLPQSQVLHTISPTPSPNGRAGDGAADVGGVVGGGRRRAVDLVARRVPQLALGQVAQQRLLLAEVLRVRWEGLSIEGRVRPVFG